MKKRQAFLALFIAAICAGYEANLLGQATNVYPAFTLRLRTTTRNPDGSVVLFDEVRYFSSSGHIHMLRKSSGGSIEEWFHLPGRGRFAVKHPEKTVVHEAFDEGRRCRVPTAQELIDSPHFLRQEPMFGITAYVHRFVDPSTGQPLRDAYYAPEVGCQSMKMIRYEGGVAESVTEAVSVEFREPDASAFVLPNYPLTNAQQ